MNIKMPEMTGLKRTPCTYLKNSGVITKQFTEEPREQCDKLQGEHNENVLQKAIDIVLQPLEQQAYVPGEMLKKKKKRQSTFTTPLIS